MKLEGYRDTFYTFSGKASELTRQLAFAGIAIIWLFKKDGDSGLSLPKELLFPGLLIVLALFFDMAHYCLATWTWRNFYLEKEKEGIPEEKELKHETWRESPIWIMFVVKISSVAAAYVFLAIFFVGQILFR